MQRALRLIGWTLLGWLSAATAAPDWPQWQSFAARYISADGRVIDPISAQAYTTSEGQSYGLFLALVAGDRRRFDQLLVWTRDNLAAGDLSSQLPAWQWGQRADGSWGVTDVNAASDADLWIAYSLIEAGRLWNERRYRVLGKLVAHRILSQETELLHGLGRTLLPAPVGFKLADSRWRLNPSYLPLPLFTVLAEADAENAGAWQALAASSQAVIVGSAGHGFAPDWVVYDAQKGFVTDPESQGLGSYNAIRVYLWAGLMADGPSRQAQLAVLGGMADLATVPERVDTASGAAAGAAPVGFAAALLPYQQALQHRDRANALLAQVTAAGWPMAGYYDSVLSLFALGHAQGRYCFDHDGHLHLQGDPLCAAPR